MAAPSGPNARDLIWRKMIRCKEKKKQDARMVIPYLATPLSGDGELQPEAATVQLFHCVLQ